MRRITTRNAVIVVVIEIFIIVVEVAIINSRATPRRVREDAKNIDTELYRGMDLINFDPVDEVSIKEAASTVLTHQCTVAFEKHHLRSPARLLREDGVIIRPSEDLYNHSAKLLGLTSERLRRSYMEDFSTVRAQGGTISPVRYGVRLTVDDRPRIFLHPTAFLGKSFLFGRLSLREVIIHEFIHAGGQPPTPWPWPFSFLRHDLAGYAPYDEIMEACQ